MSAGCGPALPPADWTQLRGAHRGVTDDSRLQASRVGGQTRPDTHGPLCEPHGHEDCGSLALLCGPPLSPSCSPPPSRSPTATPRSPPPRGVICGAGRDPAGWPWLCRYVQHYGLDGACDDVAHVLKHVAVRLRKTQKVKVLTGTGETRGLVPLAGLGDRPSERPGCLGRTSWGGGSCTSSLLQA